MVNQDVSGREQDGKFEELYEVLKDLGRRPYQPHGSSSYVAVCVEKATKYNFAVKYIQARTDKPPVDVGILFKLHHPHLIRLKEMFESHSCIYLIMELVEGELLFERLIRTTEYTEKVLVNYFKQMTEAIRYLHENGITHKNLKPENIMLSSRERDAIIKISDASLYKFLPGDTDLELVCCNPTYCAPELLKSRKVDKAFDLWALGILLYIMLRGTDPFYPKTESDLYRAILNSEIDFTDNSWGQVSRTGRDVVKRLLVVDPLLRMNTARLLTHSWVRGESTPDVQLDLAQKQLENYMQRRREENKRVSEKKSDRPSVPISVSYHCSGIPLPVQAHE